MAPKLNHWIDGRSAVPSNNSYREGVNPATGGGGVEVAQGNVDDVKAAVASAENAARSWRRFPSAQRGRLLGNLARTMRERSQELAELEIQDTGKPLAVALSEVENSAAYFEFYAGLVNFPVGDTLDVEPDQHIYTRREPFGVIGVITPWNVPLNQAARACAPALAAGNVVVVKPAEASSQTTVALAQMATEVGFPNGTFNVVLGKGSEVGTDLVRHPSVRKVAFTGSVAVGQTIGHLAADRVIPLTLELGGKSANIVFEDADLDFAAKEAVRAFTTNAGQICSAGTRLLVQRSIHDKFVRAVSEVVSTLRPGQDLGPMITRDQYQQVQKYFDVAKEEGLQTEVGGDLPADEKLQGGFYVNPTVYSNVDNSARLAQEEVFGPVLVAIPFDTEEDAIRIANSSDYGLVAAVWTKDISRAFRVTEEIEAGQVFINTWSTGAVQTPFGGHKYSGYGREKGIEALNHYSHLKCVVVSYADRQGHSAGLPD
ncbi:aldehyde dehydrogenase family protein [Arthrobacter sp. FX8]|uniref:aldehyde dehydrogenase family protein n=1 Tax=Arthrobacter sp. FX8 TaxID=2997335 RepID=UPI00227B0C9F|nr:aldehyde dehydrogenase family protein [Arthrobacter sp. FX8]WAJ33013.1 aldehyde dehydrogenase family protein [Arthrobacter sp. FX8]